MPKVMCEATMCVYNSAMYANYPESNYCNKDEISLVLDEETDKLNCDDYICDCDKKLLVRKQPTDKKR